MLFNLGFLNNIEMEYILVALAVLAVITWFFRYKIIRAAGHHWGKTIQEYEKGKQESND